MILALASLKNNRVYNQLLDLDENLKRFILNADDEQINYSIRELSNLFFTGITKQTADKAQEFLMLIKV